LTFDGDQASRPGFGWHQDVPVTWREWNFPISNGEFPGERFSRKMWNFPWNFPWFFSKMWKNHGFSMVFPGFSTSFSMFFGGFVNGLVALAEAIHWEVQGVRGPDQENNSHDGMVSTYPLVN